MSKFCICFLMCFVTKLVKKSISKCWAIEYYHYICRVKHQTCSSST
nr:MAG TPA: hypothetical protein [Caudoviricetes sp.]